EFGLLSSSKLFVGMENYIELFKDAIFRTSVTNNILYVIFSFIFQVLGGLVIAAILEDVFFRRVSVLLRTVYFIPLLISMSVIGILFTYIYNPYLILLISFFNFYYFYFFCIFFFFFLCFRLFSDFCYIGRFFF